jgi:hypothetical protein
MLRHKPFLMSMLAISSTCSLAVASTSSTEPKLAEALRQCALETNSEQRLSCFDALALRAAVPSAPAAVNPEKSFGFRGEIAKEDKQREREQEQASTPRELRSKVAAIKFRPMSPVVVTLENGQVWAQRSYDSRFDLEVGDEVTIKAAALGSFLLVGPQGGSTRVSRVR